MAGYILSILGIVVAGVLIDIVVPSGAISKYIKGIYSIFVVAVLINPIVKFMNRNHNFSIKYEEYAVDTQLLSYIHQMRAKSEEKMIEEIFNENGFKNIDIVLTISTENNELIYNSCKVNLKNLVISSDKQHINKYEFIKKTIQENVNITEEEIIFDE